MRHHINVLGLLHMVWGVFGALAGVSLVIIAVGTRLALAPSVVLAAGPRAAIWLLGIAAVLMLAASAASFRIGRQLRQFDARARQWALFLAILNLVAIPFGTALGIYTFWVLLNNDARTLFGWPMRSAT